MALTSPPSKISPTSFLSNTEPPPSISSQSRFSAQLPLQQPVSSTSQLPNTPSRAFSTSSHVASHQYVEQFRSLIEHQRQVFDEERALWHTERTELQRKVADLEATVHIYRIRCGSEVSSPREKAGFTQNLFGSFSLDDVSRHASGSTGDEFWRGAGGKSDAQPTRVFSDTLSKARVDERRLPSIAENERIGDTDGAEYECKDKPGIKRKPGLEGAKFDGINFKPSSRPPSVDKNGMTPQSPSPARSPSPTRVSHGRIDLRTNKMLSLDDPYTKDAGHTPLARRSSQLDGEISAHSIDLATPIESERQRPPMEPRPSVVRPPTERADSYFPRLPVEIDEDPELKRPLALNMTNNDEDKSFLNELNSKLIQAARSKTYEPSDGNETNELNKENAADVERKGEGKGEGQLNEPEAEPKLRMKRSMNFGSQFGSATCGRRV
ncbi:hypothetical protein MMC24_001653 [Lignoscripta atroalba]|nr:hypothetical protein [Lignoscripta atroalba]